MLTGGCLCGAVRFEIDGELGPAVECHCSMCRRANGSAFAVNATVDAAGFRVTAGDDAIREYESSPGYVRAFCARCGSPLYGRWPGDGRFRRVRLGTLDARAEHAPRAAVWTASAAPWYEPSDALERYPEAAPRPLYRPGSRGV